MKFRRKTINQLADMICGNLDGDSQYFIYRSSTYLTAFFADCLLEEYIHDGSTRKWWVAEVLTDIFDKQQSSRDFVPDGIVMVIRELMDKSDATNEDENRTNALRILNATLARERFQAYYDESGVCQLRKTGTNINSSQVGLHQRAWTADEIKKREKLIGFLDNASEDQITEEILLPLFRQLGYQRITSAGHREKILEYGKDVWMKYQLPTLHHIYFGIQVKKGKLDAAGKSKNLNVAEVYNQIQMMLGHVVFDPETNKKALVDHAMIISAGIITKQARNWLGEKLTASQRSQILFMDRSNILDLMLLQNIPLPSSLSISRRDKG
ncbi:MAG: hypothetical protein AAFY41_16005, partial [Bacteroidota bacterium]